MDSASQRTCIQTALLAVLSSGGRVHAVAMTTAGARASQIQRLRAHIAHCADDR